MERKRILRPLSWPLDHLRPLNLAYLRLEKKLFTSPRLLSVISNSERGRDEIVRRFSVPPTRIAVVRNGVDLARFPLERRDASSSALRALLGIGAEETIFLYVGSGFARKGVGALTRAAVRLARTGAKFRVVVVGKGDAGPYRRILREGGAEGRVHFTGPVAGAAEFLLGADAFVFPTIYEPFSNACLEAMAACLPVITTAVNGVSEVIRDGVSGLVVDDPMGDAGIADRMERLLSVDTRRRMGEEARRAAAALTPERNAEETLSVLEAAWRKKTGLREDAG
jgi:UDP-glucose:(heptosyl)LPS alpha-1,3-glucosyltransferase